MFQYYFAEFLAIKCVEKDNSLVSHAILHGKSLVTMKNVFKSHDYLYMKVITNGLDCSHIEM